jgi:hypothetical protein
MREFYNIIPSIDKCRWLVSSSGLPFSRYDETVDGHLVEAFKYHFMEPTLWDSLDDGRINMRGITFVDGILVALPFPKFFNAGERPCTQDLDRRTAVMVSEKLDGSLISMYRIGSEIKAKTMLAPFGDTSVLATAYLATRPDVVAYSTELIDLGLSPMFEFVSPDMKIVLAYPVNDFAFLGARSMSSGEIHLAGDPSIPATPASIRTPRRFSSPEEVDAYLLEDGVEGVVEQYPNGTLVKRKSLHYLAMHDALNNLTPKTILRAIRDQRIDDIYGALDNAKATDAIVNVHAIEDEYFAEIRALEEAAEDYSIRYAYCPNSDIHSTVATKHIAWLIFQHRAKTKPAYDGKEFRKYAMKIMVERYKNSPDEGLPDEA